MLKINTHDTSLDLITHQDINAGLGEWFYRKQGGGGGRRII